MTDLPVRYMCYDGQPMDDGPALDVEEVVKWCIHVLHTSKDMEVAIAAEYLKREVKRLQDHCLSEGNNEDNKAKCDDN